MNRECSFHGPQGYGLKRGVVWKMTLKIHMIMLIGIVFYGGLRENERLKLIRGVKSCICSTKISILVIRTLFGFFQSFRGTGSGAFFLFIYTY